MSNLRQGHWKGDPALAVGHDLQGKTLGILGMGAIGRRIQQRATVSGMTVIYHNRSKLDAEMAGPAKFVTFEELLKTSDALSLNLPSNPRTRHIISSEQFKLMKPTCVIINTARGAVLDENALVEALNGGLIA
ncbi:hypothetical protein MMC06_006483, partial [Schaereria dolodes]|nr:hypothetical protein [Schaereria dolodes]